MSDTYNVTVDTTPDIFTVSVNSSPDVYNVIYREAMDGQDGAQGIDGENGIDGIAPIIQDAGSELEISTDGGNTFTTLVSYQEIMDATDVQSRLDDKGNLEGGNIWYGSQEFNDNVTLGGTAGETITLNARFVSHLYPSTSNTRDLGSSSLRFKDLWLSGKSTVAGSMSSDSLSTGPINCSTITATGYTNTVGLTSTGKVTATAQGSLSTLGSNDVMTKALADASYGQMFTLLDTTYTTASSITNVNSSTTITLSAGTYAYSGFIGAYCNTNGSTGVYVEIKPLFTGGVSSMKTIQHRGVSYYGLNTLTGQFIRYDTNASYFASCNMDAGWGATNGVSQLDGYLVLTSAKTFGLSIRQSGVTDATRPAHIMPGSIITFKKIAY